MAEVKKYFKEECQPHMLGVDHLNPSDFYLSVWQKNRSATPLLILRTLLFLTSVGIVVTSITIDSIDGYFKYWFIYLTHWGLTLIVFATGFGAAVSLRCFIYGPITTSGLPWYVRIYWVLYNCAVPVAFLITIFYWTILYEANVVEKRHHGLDVAVHGINSIIVFLLLITSSQPSRLLHMCQPITFALIYFIFGLIYYLAGGTNTEGDPYVYTVVDWRYPGITIGVSIGTGLLMVVLYALTVGIAKARDAISSKCIKPAPTPPEALPLRQPQQSDV